MTSVRRRNGPPGATRVSRSLDRCQSAVRKKPRTVGQADTRAYALAMRVGIAGRMLGSESMLLATLVGSTWSSVLTASAVLAQQRLQVRVDVAAQRWEARRRPGTFRRSDGIAVRRESSLEPEMGKYKQGQAGHQVWAVGVCGEQTEQERDDNAGDSS